MAATENILSLEYVQHFQNKSEMEKKLACRYLTCIAEHYEGDTMNHKIIAACYLEMSRAIGEAGNKIAQMIDECYWTSKRFFDDIISRLANMPCADIICVTKDTLVVLELIALSCATMCEELRMLDCFAVSVFFALRKKTNRDELDLFISTLEKNNEVLHVYFNNISAGLPCEDFAKIMIELQISRVNMCNKSCFKLIANTKNDCYASNIMCDKIRQYINCGLAIPHVNWDNNDFKIIAHSCLDRNLFVFVDGKPVKQKFTVGKAVKTKINKLLHSFTLLNNGRYAIFDDFEKRKKCDILLEKCIGCMTNFDGCCCSGCFLVAKQIISKYHRTDDDSYLRLREMALQKIENLCYFTSSCLLSATDCCKC